MDRDVFLTRVRKATATGLVPDAPGLSEALPRMPTRELVALFSERAREVDAMVHGPFSPHEVPQAVVEIASGHGGERFMAWDDLPAPGVVSALASVGLDRMGHDVPVEGRVEHQSSYRHLDLGITGADAGLAESGSVVLLHGPGRPRMASLAANVHLAILELSRLHRTLAHWAGRHPALVEVTSNLVVVTGPSRSGDIEMELNLGVHGPRHVHVVMVR